MIITNVWVQLKKEISSSYWPTDGSLAQIAEEWGLKYRGRNVTYELFAGVMSGTNATTIAMLNDFENHISDNFLKVSWIFCLDFPNLYKQSTKALKI